MELINYPTIDYPSFANMIDSILSSLSKVFEILMMDQIESHLLFSQIFVLVAGYCNA